MLLKDKSQPTSPHFSSTFTETIHRGLDWLDAKQSPEGYWVGMLESNACMEAEWLLAFHVLGIKQHDLVPGLIAGILQRQREDGSWEIYHAAANGDINSTVECYAALRCWGLPSDHPQLQKALHWILQHGLQNIRVFTRYWLALIGEWPWEKTPNLPPEIIFLPKWIPFNIYHFACWARATMVPLCILSAHRTVVPLAEDNRLDALFPQGRDAFDYSLPHKDGVWSAFFNLADAALKVYQKTFKHPPRRKLAMRLCTEWIVRHQDADGSWGGIQPPWIYSLMALKQMGYANDHPVMDKGISTLLDHWSYERNNAQFIQACESPIWDTLLSLMAYLDCGETCSTSTHVAMGVQWLIDQQVLVKGDWAEKVEVEPGGWAFERANLHYPDVDDTAVALIILARAKESFENQPMIETAISRGLNWVLAMQCKNGGWGAFDKDNDKAILTKIPFSDFGETIDPASVDVTAHVLEALGYLGLTSTHKSVRNALEFIYSEQESDGSWFGRWGVNHIYGIAAVLPALEAIGENMASKAVQRAAKWIVEHQNEDGGWGESCASYMDSNYRGAGPSTASQTGWAMMSLIATDNPSYIPALKKAVNYLMKTQKSSGSWDEKYYTGTGFPGYGIGKRSTQAPQQTLIQSENLEKGFMINYNMYRHYFPLMALGRFKTFQQN